MSHGRLIPYDFRNQDHILKFELTGSMDKLEGLPKVPIEEVTEEKKEESISIPEVKDDYRWIIYVVLVVVIGLLLMFFMKGKRPKYPKKLSE
jgi:hypothetical protein